MINPRKKIKRKVQSKKHNQISNARREHFRKRMLERYGVKVDGKLYHSILRSIRNTGIPDNGVVAEFFQQVSNTRSIFILHFGDKAIPIVYNKQDHTIVTALPD